MREPDAAKIAYEAYVWHLDRVHAATMPLPAWERVRQDIKDAWQAATQAAMSAQIPGDAPGLAPLQPAVPDHVRAACDHCWHKLVQTQMCCWCGKPWTLQHGPYLPEGDQ